YFEMGGVDAALPHFEAAVQRADDLLRASPDDAEAKRLWCRTRLRLADVLLNVTSTRQRARDLVGQVLPFARQWAAADLDRPAARFCLLAARDRAAFATLVAGDRRAALTEYESMHSAIADGHADTDDEFLDLFADV